MKTYYYKDGIEVKVGDITFYSEYDGKNDSFRYADSIKIIIEKEDGLHFSHRVCTKDDSQTFQLCEVDQNEDTVHIRFGTEFVFDGTDIPMGKGCTLQHSTCIGHISTDSLLISEEYAKYLSDKFYNETKIK
ncbi:hypothetical protein [Dysgonomonas sp.]|uniref:hypothetical protein n=1 Tax=Dysgonomonas sp. TaxID=1891233 RepID=UPI0027B8CC25|nr:hypothetical protein [Dysgonomonas sp.]